MSFGSAQTQLSELAPTALELKLGQVAGFEILECIGSGGMGRVFAARAHNGGAKIALKLMLNERLSGSEATRFSREAEVLARLKHPGIVRYIAHGITESGAAYLAMEWLDGIDLARRLQRGPLTVEQTIDLASRVAEALKVAHIEGVIHRDIKPANVFLVGEKSDDVRLLDFGIARYSGQAHALTRPGGIVGTPGYMSPEQARGSKDMDHRGDLFSLGCLLHECLTGVALFEGGHAMAVLARVLLEDAVRVQSIVPETPDWLDRLIAWLLEKKPHRRPDSAMRVLDILNRRDFRDSLNPSTSQHLTAIAQVLLSVIFVVLPDYARDSVGTSESVSRIVNDYGGTLIRLVDGSLLISISTPSGAGAPSDRAAMAARCALAIRDSFPVAEIVLVSGYGVQSQGTIVGNILDRGAGVLKDAVAGEILLDEGTAAFLEAQFRVARDSDRVLLDGVRTDPTATRTLLGRSTPFVGRGRDLGAITGVLRDVVEESCAGVMVVIGEPGVGKSRIRYELVHRLTSDEEHFELLVGRGDPLHTGAPFHLVAQAIRRAVGVRDGEPLDSQRRKIRARFERSSNVDIEGDWTPFLLELTGVAGDNVPDDVLLARSEPTLMRQRVHDAWGRWLKCETSRAPVVFILEDLHWGDRASVELIDTALRDLEDHALFVLAFARPSVLDRFPDLWSARDPVVHKLAPLSRRAGRRLIRSVLGNELDTVAVNRLLEISNGNAFFLEELIRTTRASARALNADIPETILGMMEARMASLADSARSVLRAASVFGQVFWDSSVQALIGEHVATAPLAAILHKLVEDEWVTARSESSIPGAREFVFRHALVRDAAYSTLTEQNRELGHRLAGAWLEKQGLREPLALAEHYSRGADPAQALPWFILAATQALEGDDLDAAIELASRGLDCSPEGQSYSILHRVIGEARLTRGFFDDATLHLKAAAESLTENTEPWFDVLRLLFEALGRRGRFDELRAWINIALNGDISPPDAKIRALCQLVTHFTYNGRADDADRIAQHVDEIMFQTSEANPLTRIDFHRMWAVLWDEKGYPERGLEQAEKAREAARDVGMLRAELDAELLLGHFSAQLGAMEKSRAHYERIARYCDRVGMLAWGLGAYIMLGLIALNEGQYDEAKIALERGAAMSVGQHPRYEGSRLAVFARLACAKGQVGEAVRHAHAAEVMLRVAPPLHVFGMSVLAEALHAAGQVEEAERVMSSASLELDRLGSIAEFEFAVRAIHVRILIAQSREGETRSRLQSAMLRLEARANAIERADYRRSFLNRVSDNYWLMKQARKRGLLDGVLAAEYIDVG